MSDYDSSEEVPQFGLVDVIEAFTAMRHQWRTQTQEHRQLGESLQITAAQLGELETRLLAAIANATELISAATSDDTAARLAEMIAEIDHHLTRAVEAVTATDPSAAGTSADELKQTIDEEFNSLGPVKRWIFQSAADRIRSFIDDWARRENAAAEATHEGLQMLVQRMRRLMSDHQIQRIETIGQPFDGETMNAVEAIASTDQPSGHVMEQIRPAYRWRGRMLKYADVRVAK